MKKPIITICIIHYRKLPQLKKTIKKLEKYTNFPYQIRIINQEYENEKIAKYLKKLEKRSNFLITRNQKNNGCGGGRAQLTKNIDTPYAMTMDDDIYVHKNWLKPVLNFLEKNKNAGAVSFPLYSPEGKLDGLGGNNLLINKNNNTIKQKSIDKAKIKNNKNKFIKIDNPSSGIMVFKKELLNDVSWDPKYFIGFDDLDIGMQINFNSKFETYIYTGNKLIHDKVSKDKKNKKYNKQRRNYKKIRKSYIHFKNKWKYQLNQPVDWFYTYICLLPNFIIQNLVFTWLNYVKPLLK